MESDLPVKSFWTSFYGLLNINVLWLESTPASHRCCNSNGDASLWLIMGYDLYFCTSRCKTLLYLFSFHLIEIKSIFLSNLDTTLRLLNWKFPFSCLQILVSGSTAFKIKQVQAFEFTFPPEFIYRSGQSVPPYASKMQTSFKEVEMTKYWCPHQTSSFNDCALPSKWRNAPCKLGKIVRILKFIINPILEEFSVTVEHLIKGARSTKFLLNLKIFLPFSEQDSTKRVQTY